MNILLLFLQVRTSRSCPDKLKKPRVRPFLARVLLREELGRDPIQAEVAAKLATSEKLADQVTSAQVLDALEQDSEVRTYISHN